MSTNLEKEPMEELTTDENSVTDSLLAVINGRDYVKKLSSIDISIDESDRSIMLKASSVILEQFGIDISNRYKVQKTGTNIWLIPNSTAG